MRLLFRSMSKQFPHDKSTLFEDHGKGGSCVNRMAARFPWVRFSLFLIVCFGIFFPFTKTGKDAVRALTKTKIRTIIKKVPAEPITIPATVTPSREVVPSRVVVPRIPTVAISKDVDVRKTLKGFRLNYKANFQEGGLASNERKSADSYVAEFTLKVKIPKASTTIDQLARVNPHLPKILPGLERMLANAKVSDFYTQLYNNKTKRLKTEVMNLGKVLSMHNFYDCETMLEMTDPDTKRKVFIFQADMDVVTDGSDGDRLAIMPSEVVNSTYYQPFTSYGWKKTSKIPNPMVAGWKQRVANAEAELKLPTVVKVRKDWLGARMQKLKIEILDMQRRSFLIAEHDPFIVVSTDLLTASSSYKFAPRVGDYVAVVHGNKVYPAIVGDGGPTFKAGEASLRMAKQINSVVSSYNRAVSDLGVTYVVFPRTGDTVKSAPDYEKWHKRCGELLEEIGGLAPGYELHQWENTLPSQESETLETEEIITP